MQTQNNKIEIGNILNTAFFYWSKTIKYQIIFSVFYFSLLFAAATFAFNYYGLAEKVDAFSDLLRTNPTVFTEKAKELGKTENFALFAMAIMIIKAFIYPLNIGLLNIYRKVDLGEELFINDIFAGYIGLNFFKFLGYGLFWGIIYSYAGLFFPLMLLWILVTVFVSPLMFFNNKSILQSISITFNTLKTNAFLILICVIFSILFSYSGALMFGFGIMLTFPFWNAMIYTLYKNLLMDFK